MECELDGVARRRMGYGSIVEAAGRLSSWFCAMVVLVRLVFETLNFVDGFLRVAGALVVCRLILRVLLFAVHATARCGLKTRGYLTVYFANAENEPSIIGIRMIRRDTLLCCEMKTQRVEGCDTKERKEDNSVSVYRRTPSSFHGQ